MNLLNKCLDFASAFLRGILGSPDDDEGLKAERVQFWEDQLDPAWMVEGHRQALLRTIVCSDRNAAQRLAKKLNAKLADHGYSADVLATVGSVISVRLTTSPLGVITERDYAAAVMIDLII